MTYGSNCSKINVSNHNSNKRRHETREGNLRSLGTGSGALVPRVTRDTHLDCVCGRRVELAKSCRDVRVRSVWEISWIGKIRCRADFCKFAISSVGFGALRRVMRTWIMTYLAGRWSSGCAKAGGIEVRDGF
jgi:hypothetical protein